MCSTLCAPCALSHQQLFAQYSTAHKANPYRAGLASQDFSWLQRCLRQGSGARLTSNELAYPLHSKEVFEVPPLMPGFSGSDSGGGSGWLDSTSPDQSPY